MSKFTSEIFQEPINSLLISRELKVILSNNFLRTSFCKIDRPSKTSMSSNFSKMPQTLSTEIIHIRPFKSRGTTLKALKVDFP